MPRKNMKDGLYTAGEIARRAGLTRQTVHHYTVLGLIAPVERTGGGFRLYAESALRRIRLVRGLLSTGYTLRDLSETYFKEK